MKLLTVLTLIPLVLVLAQKDPVQEAIVIDAGTQETTQFGTKINNTDSLTAGERGPTLLEDFMLREKVMHFDHERIPERVVHARGVGAHGYFQTYTNWSNITAANFLQDPETKTPVFVRFSTVLGSRGSPDTVRDVRGFATRFYTQDGLWDLVGNVIAPFFIQDAIKFPDLIHAAKPEPDKEVPQAGTAHCTSYDFFSQHTESMHTVIWALSGRGLVKSFRQVEGFGVHTFRLITEDEKVVFVKFIWKPLQGLSNLVWDEAQKIAGKDIDYHRNDLYTAIENGDFPQYELCAQIVPEEDEDKYDFDLLDATKIIPESIVPAQCLGKMTLNRNVDNFFSETEQITFHLGHIVRGITFTDDPLLQGRLFSYTDTQVNRMNSVNYMQLPINQPLNPVHNNQRDGYMQRNVYKGKVAYYPNTLQNNTPAVVSPQEGGYLEYPEQVCKQDYQPGKDNSDLQYPTRQASDKKHHDESEKIGAPLKLSAKKQRGKSGKFADHFSQAQLFYNSLTTFEQQQVVDGARFEIGKCNDNSVRENMVQALNYVDHNLAVRIATYLGLNSPQDIYPNANMTSVGLSIEKYKLPENIRAKKVAILTAPGIEKNQVEHMLKFLTEKGAYVDLIGVEMNKDVAQTYLTASSVLYDAVFVPNGNQEAFDTLKGDTSLFPYKEPAMFILDAYRHGKPIAASGLGKSLLKAARLPNSVLNNAALQEQKKYGVLIMDDLDALHQHFEQAIRKQRFWIRLPLDPNATPSPTQ